uniref:Protein Skeletor n=1 Tax=Timema tahoe TaxID=61484 RepID=A0A7R9FM49_9NEOP|nr:unnamed protein product [Timema tahoe]
MLAQCRAVEEMLGSSYRPLTKVIVLSGAGEGAYHGKSLGKLKTLHHGVSGEVFAVDARTLHIRDFSYDGEGPAAYFYVGNSKAPSQGGLRLSDEKGSNGPLPRYRKKHVTISLPESTTLNNIKWFSVWCDDFSVNFGDVKIPKNLDYPKPQKIDALNGVHAVSSENIVVVDAQTLLIPSFSYDGEAPDAKFWVGRGPKPSSQGVRVADENGKEEPLRRYDRKTIVLTLPGDLTVFDIGHFGVWCEAFAVDFGHIRVPARSLNVPPSLHMLGVSPQSKLNCEVLWDDLALEVRWAVAGDSVVMQLVSKLEDGEYMSFGLSGDDSRSRMIGGDVVVAWVDKDTLKGYAQDYFLDSKSQCAGTRGSCPDNRLRDNTNSVRLLNAAMVNGYSIVTYQRPLVSQDELDRTVLTNGSQAVIWAVGPLNSRNEVSYHSITSKGDLLLEFGRTPKWNCPLPESDPSRRLQPAEQEEDDEDQFGAGQRHQVRAVRPRARTCNHVTRNTVFRCSIKGEDNGVPQCSQGSSLSTTPARRVARPIATPAPAPQNDAWDIPAIQCYEPEDGVFYAQMGPTGGKRGYPAITGNNTLPYLTDLKKVTTHSPTLSTNRRTLFVDLSLVCQGHVGWGISWYINGLLIPEINVVRGKTYSFVVEGGLDPEVPARYHPFYITDDPVGGYEHKTPEERAEVRIFAGAKQTRRGDVFPTGTGRLCNWTPDPKQPPADEFASFGAYQRTLTLECDQGEPGLVEWTPDQNTPDTVYYQCYTHRYLGWRINVLDACDSSDAASEPVPARVPSGGRHDPFEDAEELESSPSILVETRVRPNGLYSGGKTVVSPKNRVDVEFLKQSSEGYSQRYEDYTVRFADNTFLPLPAIQDDALLPPPAIQKEPPRYAHGETAPQDSSKVQNTVSPDSKESSATIKTTELPSSSSTEGPTIRVTSELPTTTSSKPLSLITVDPKRKPIVHATTPYSLLQLESKGESQEQRTLLDYDKTSGLVQESQQSTVVIDGNQLNSSDQPKLPAGLFRVASKRPAPLNPLHVTGVPYPHSTIPQSHVGPLYPQMMFQRPPHHYTVPPIRRPYPQRAYSRPLQGGVHRPPFMPPGVKFNPKKPFYRVPIMGGPHHPVMVTPQFHHPMGYHHMPGHSPVPLKYHQYQHQQQQGSNKFYQLIAPNSQKVQVQKAPPSTSTPTTTTATPTTTTTTLAPASSTTHEPEVVTLATISPAPSSDANSSTDLPVAVNTGFHPDSVIVEGGFKPIIHQKAVAEDRSSLGEPPVNDPEDEVVSGTKEERKDNPFEGQKSELFEPMFIPSPPDRIIGNQTVVKKPGVLSEDLTPPAVIQGKPSRPYDVSGRTHPDMRRPLYPNKKTSNFHHPPRGVDFRHQQSRDETPMAEERMDAYYHNSRRGVFEDETPMAAERMETYYLPPQYSTPRRAPIPPGVIVTYDGKPVVDGSLSSPPNAPSAPHRGGSLALVRGTPQFGPFLGEVPPPVPDVKPSRLTPEDFGEEFPDPPSLRSTQLSPLDEGETPLDILLPDGTELKEEVVLFKDAKSKKQAPKKTGSVGETPGNDGGTHEYPQSTDVNSSSESDVVERTSETADQKHPPRRRRSAHHEPGHEEDHSGHDHGAHNQQSSPNHSSSVSSNISLTKLLSLGLLSMAILKFLQELKYLPLTRILQENEHFYRQVSLAPKYIPNYLVTYILSFPLKEKGNSRAILRKYEAQGKKSEPPLPPFLYSSFSETEKVVIKFKDTLNRYSTTVDININGASIGKCCPIYPKSELSRVDRSLILRPSQLHYQLSVSTFYRHDQDLHNSSLLFKVFLAAQIKPAHLVISQIVPMVQSNPFACNNLINK